MAPDSAFRVVNWERFQHYKHRNPPWIKLHRELLTSRVWVTGTDADRVLAVALMLLAGGRENRIPDDPAYIKCVTYLNSVPNLSRLVDLGFIEPIGPDASNLHADASKTLAPTCNLRTNADPEKEKRQSRDREEKTPSKKRAPNGACERIYDSYPRHVGKRAALRAVAKALLCIQEEKQCSADDAIDFLYSQVIKFAASPAGQRGKFTPHCSNWMNEGRYLDDPVEWHLDEQRGNGNGVFKTTAQQVEAANSAAFERARADRQRTTPNGD